MRRHFRKIIRAALCLCLCIAAALSAAVCPAGAEDTAVSARAGSIDLKNPDFIRGMDVSSVISLESSGVVFRDRYGRADDVFKILAENGVNYIRVRVWNDPYSIDGIGYGGGNNDVQTAAAIGKRAAKYGMKLLVDFHYSDFWADPGKQKAPKAWSGMTLSEKVSSVSSFTSASLRTIRDAGADIGMVQIGNETNNGIAGENTWQNMARIYNAGSAAVREFDPEVLVAVHYADPQNASFLRSLADFLYNYNVDYDVFAVSYYPYWHGSLSNLTGVLDYAAVKYHKYAMVAETSYAYTLTDSDGHPNTVSEYANNTGENLLWEFSPQGQAKAFRAVVEAVNEVDDGLGLGVFYWEGAWITVGDTSALSGEEFNERLLSNKTLWERDGSGWASSESNEYDPDGGRWYGGSAVDNQAFFLPDGTALPSISVFSDILPDTAYRTGDADNDKEISVTDPTCVQRFCAGLHVSSGSGITIRGDVDSDGSLTVIDATVIQRYLAGLYTPCPVGIWKWQARDMIP